MQALLGMYCANDDKLVKSKLTVFIKDRVHLADQNANICVKPVKNTAQDRKYLLGYVHKDTNRERFQWFSIGYTQKELMEAWFWR